MKSAMNIVNAQWNLTYDSSKLRLKTAVDEICPNLNGTTNQSGNTVYGVFSNITNLANFTTSKPFVQAEFEVIGKGYADVNLTVDELSVGYISSGKLQYANAVKNGTKQNISSQSGFSSNNITGTASVVNGSVSQPATDLTVNATSNLFPTATKVVAASESQVTVEYVLQSNKKILNSEWTLTYDTSKLRFNKSATGEMMPNSTGAETNEKTSGTIKGTNSSTSKDNFSTEKVFVRATFDVLAKGTANVNLNVSILGLTSTVYLVDNSTIQNVKAQSGFSDFTYATKTRFGNSGNVGGKINLKTTSNFFNAATRQLNDSTQVTVAFQLSSVYKVLSAQWELTYDTNKLRLASDLDVAMPFAGDDAVVLEKTKGTVKGNFSTLGTLNFKTQRDFVTLTFDIIGSGDTTVNMNLINLGVKNTAGKTGYVVDHSVDQKLNKQAGFTESKVYNMTLNMPNGKTDRIKGDVNFDGMVNVSDATIIQQKIAEIVLFNTDQTQVADFYSDGNVDITDVTYIQKHAAS